MSELNDFAAVKTENATVFHASNLDVLPLMADNSVDSIVCDPPYELGFMGKSWDSTGIAYSVELWRECLRVLKPGGHLLAFGGSRTWHRLAVAIEDAGFEVRDSIAWLYGSGFPKSLDISKAIDKKPEMAHTKNFKLWLEKQIQNSGKTRNQIDDECGFTACSYAKTDGKDGWSNNHPTKEKWAKMKMVLNLPDDWDWIITDNLDERGYIEPTGGLHGGTGNTVGKWAGSGQQLSNNAISPDAQKWQGWGTALKPAFEPVVVARKPLVGTVAANVLEWGVGGLNIDASRIAGEVPSVPNPNWDRSIDSTPFGAAERKQEMSVPNNLGRWPANIILDDYTAELLDEQSGISKRTGGRIGKKETSNINFGLSGKYEKGDPGFGDVGGASRYFFVSKEEKENGTNHSANSAGNSGNGNSAENFGELELQDGFAEIANNLDGSRFFYQPKASKRDRNEGLDELPLVKAGSMTGAEYREARPTNHPERQNFHPTVKPTDLMRYLIKLVTPAGGIVLDPFTGSGSTGKAALLDGYKFLGIELTADYLPIIEGRLKWAEAEAQRQAQATAEKENEVLF